jgi:pheromone shutdown protein TraB
MPTHARNGGVGGAAKEVAEHASAIARLELELAALELKRKVVALGLGIGLLGASLVFGLLLLGFAFATAAAALALVVDWWLALLIVTGVLAALATTLGLVGLGLIRKGSPPVPKQTIAEAKLTTAALRR